MARAKFEGRHFAVEGQTLTIFDHKGFPREGKWVWGDAQPGNSIVVAVLKPNPVSGEIEEFIAGDTRAGRRDLIDHILISDFWAFVLWAEGKLTADDLYNAQEDDTTIIVKLNFGGCRRTVKIRRRDCIEFHGATMDANGNIV